MQFSKEEKALWLEDWRLSGKSAWSYAKENGLIPQTFCGWVKREAKSGSVSKQDTCFVEIPARKKPGQEQQQEILVEKGDIKIHVPLSVWIDCPGVIMEGLRAAP